MTLFCQILLIVQLVATLLSGLYQDIHGRKERKPLGFTGAVITVSATALISLIYWKAGALSLVLGS